MILNLINCFSDTITTMLQLSYKKFKLCSENIEFRRRAIHRRRKFSRQLAVFSTMLAKRKRNNHPDRISINQIARKLEAYIEKKDQADTKLFARYIATYDTQIRQTLQKLKDASTKVDHIFARVAGTHKFTMWVAACRDFMRRIRVTLDMSGPWVCSGEVVKRLKITLSQMSSYQSTTQIHWLQLEVKQLLQQTLEELFWD